MWRITEIYISFTLKADHNQNLQSDWDKSMFKKVLMKEENSMEGEEKEWADKKEVFGLHKAIRNRSIIKDR